MSPKSVRRAIISWLLLLLIAAGIGWITSRREGLQQIPGLAGAADSAAPQGAGHQGSFADR